MSKHFEHICPFCEEIYCVNLPNDVQAVLTAAKRVRQTPFYKRVALIDAVINLNNTVRDLEEMESKDETQ